MLKIFSLQLSSLMFRTIYIYFLLGPYTV